MRKNKQVEEEEEKANEKKIEKEQTKTLKFIANINLINISSNI